jgi:hypothetical protein
MMPRKPSTRSSSNTFAGRGTASSFSLLNRIVELWEHTMRYADRDLKFLLVWSSIVLSLLMVDLVFMFADFTIAVIQSHPAVHFPVCLAGAGGCAFVLMPTGLAVMFKFGAAAPAVALDDNFSRVSRNKLAGDQKTQPPEVPPE